MDVARQQGVHVKRVSSRKRSRSDLKRSRSDLKRSRSDLKTHLTPARKRGGASWRSSMEEGPAAPYCSDSEDLFGDYDSLLEDSSVLARLDDAEHNERQRNVQQEDVQQRDVQQRDVQQRDVQQVNVYQRDVQQVDIYQRDIQQRDVHQRDVQQRDVHQRDVQQRHVHQGDVQPELSPEDILTDSVLDVLGDEAFEDLPSSQLQFQEDVQRKRSRQEDGDKTSTPVRDRKATRRRSVAELMKRTMLGNAASPAAVSRSAVMKDAVVCEEISVAKQAMETVCPDIPDLGPFFGLPSRVQDLLFSLRGISRLYDWQQTCLDLDCVQQRRNLVYSLPTSGGKTLVAEILVLRELLCRKKDCLLVLPYISLVQEKVRGLAGLGLALDFLVEEYAGSKGRFPPTSRRTRKSVYVATIEKAHSLVNSLIETCRIQDLGLVVVDELHMLGDGSRGATLEMTLAKLLYTSRQTQIIGMSATLGNIRDLQTFLRAENYSSDFRPVQLKEFVKLNNTIYEVDPKEDDCFRFSRVLNAKYSSSMQRTDPDQLIALVTEVIPTHSCLVFCPTKKNCENVAAMICRHLKQDFLQVREEEKCVLLRELKAGGNGAMCPVLRRTVPYGLAYHHGGLTAEERRLLEDAYAAGVLCLLACTSTLAAGINLPARRVILRSPYVATDFLKRSQYKQMIGRAGRAGIDAVGESVLILQDKDRDQVKSLVCAPMENCYSNLLLDQDKGLLSLLLSLVGLNISRSVDQMLDFLRGTLLSVQRDRLCVDRTLEDAVQHCVDILKDKDLISETAGQGLQVTQLGRATYKGSVDLVYSEVLYRDLSKGLEGLLLNSFLHLVYLVTPYDMVSQVKPDWMVFFRQFTLLMPAEQKMSAAVGVPESFIARKAAGQTVRKAVDLLLVQRMYLALVLVSLLKEASIWTVSERFQLSRGFIQSLLSSASAFCSCVLHFTEELQEFWPFRSLLVELTRRLSYCVTAELIPLMEVAGVMESRAKQLYNAGYKTLTHLANADPAALASTIDNLFKKQANQIVASAKMLLNEKAAALQQEVDELLAAPPDLPTAV